MQRKYHSNLSFNDLLFNVLLGFVVLFFIAFLLINPPTKKDEVPLKAEVVIMLEWPSELTDDIDLWVMGPDNIRVGFKNKETGLLHLDRDDLGMTNDTVKIGSEIVVNRINREIITIRGKVPGDYYVSVHYYGKRAEGPVPVTVTVMDVNPYKEIYTLTVPIMNRGQEVVLPGFVLDEEANWVENFRHQQSIVPTIGGN